jgi:hypothetical protein
MPEHDDQPRGLKPGQRELERALRSLAPRAPRVDPVAAAFDAGRRSSRRHVQLWRSAAAALLLIAGGSWLIPIGRRGADVTRPVSPGSTLVIHMRPLQPAPAQPLPDESLIMLQQAMREKGLDGLPAPRLPAVRPVAAGDLF